MFYYKQNNFNYPCETVINILLSQTSNIKMADNNAMEIVLPAHIPARYYNFIRQCLEILDAIINCADNINVGPPVRCAAYVGYDRIHDRLGHDFDEIRDFINSRRINMPAGLYENLSTALREVISSIQDENIPLPVQSEILDIMNHQLILF